MQHVLLTARYRHGFYCFRLMTWSQRERTERERQRENETERERDRERQRERERERDSEGVSLREILIVI